MGLWGRDTQRPLPLGPFGVTPPCSRTAGSFPLSITHDATHGRQRPCAANFHRSKAGLLIPSMGSIDRSRSKAKQVGARRRPAATNAHTRTHASSSTATDCLPAITPPTTTTNQPTHRASRRPDKWEKGGRRIGLRARARHTTRLFPHSPNPGLLFHPPPASTQGERGDRQGLGRGLSSHRLAYSTTMDECCHDGSGSGWVPPTPPPTTRVRARGSCRGREGVWGCRGCVEKGGRGDSID